MKKLTNTLLGLTVLALLLSSCGADSDVLSQFSKRKYLKRSKATKQYELAKIDQIENESTETLALANTEVDSEISFESDYEEAAADVDVLSDDESVQFIEDNPVGLIQVTKNWKAYNRSFVANPVLSGDRKTTWAYNNEFNNSQQVSEVVIAILCIFLPPLAVYLYEDSITTNFWVDLVATILFWFPGMIVAFLICFAGVSFG